MPLDPATPAQIAQIDKDEALAELAKFNADQAMWNSQCGGARPLPVYNACQESLAGLNARKAAIVARLEQFGIQVKDLPPGVAAPPPPARRHQVAPILRPVPSHRMRLLAQISISRRRKSVEMSGRTCPRVRDLIL